MSKTERVAIYGGTFNPPHIGHVRSAEAFSKAINPDKLLIIPDFLPPHKEMDFYVSAEDRLRMCELAFASVKNAKVSDIEIKRGGKSYTADTLSSLSSENRELYLLCGTDMFITMSSWYRPDVIFELATVCFVRRENDTELAGKIAEAKAKYEREYNAKIIEINTDVIELSSSELRQSLMNKDENLLIPTEVLSYIRERGLY